MTDEMCHCGKPLHYTDKEVEEKMKSMVKDKGRYIAVTNYDTMKMYKVDRHYIALHGITGDDLHKLGFQEIK